jgi:hypothetical protein
MMKGEAMAKKKAARTKKKAAGTERGTILLSTSQIVNAIDAIANSKASLCLRLEACRKLKSQLIEEARNRFPFKEHKEADVSLEKVKKYGVLIARLESVYREEEDLWIQLNPDEKADKPGS